MILHIFHKIHSILLPCKMDSLYMSNFQYMPSVSVVCTVQFNDTLHIHGISSGSRQLAFPNKSYTEVKNMIVVLATHPHIMLMIST